MFKNHVEGLVVLETTELESFANWYSVNKASELETANKKVKMYHKLKKEFLAEWPIERLGSMSIDEYVQGKGSDNKSFCYELEHGKYKELYLSIKGGSAGKFGIYYSKESQAYCDHKNEIITIEDLDHQFKKLKMDLVEIVKKGINLEFNESVFNKNTSQNQFLGKSAIVIKLLCVYSPSPKFIGINNRNNTKNIWYNFVKPEDEGNVYRQNYETATLLHSKFPELNSDNLSIVLWKYLGDQPKKMEAKQSNEIGAEELELETNSVVKLSKQLEKNYNIILRGAPGTGKTYLAKQIAAQIISNGVTKDLEKLTKEQKKQYEFVQFHPSYDYTDFVEGLRPISNTNSSIGFKLQDGIFKQFVNQARNNYEATDITKEIVKPYVFIIDEINRGEISKIFGELFFSMDPGYRGKAGEVKTQYANLHETEEHFYIPKNVYIIGTMNDIDRSVDTFDFAMRRRFSFIEISAEDSQKMLENKESIIRMNQLNSSITSLENGGLSEDYKVGASYFIMMDNTEKSVQELWKSKLQPLLKDYFRGEHNSRLKLEKLKAAYFNEEKQDDDTD